MFDPKAYLEKFGGDAEAALAALQKDRLRATRAKNALLEQLGLSSDDEADHTDAVKKLTAELKAYKALGEPAAISAQIQLGAAALESFKSLESDPAKLLEVVKAAPKRLVTAEAEVSALKRGAVVRSAAESYGFKPSVLQKLLETEKLELAFDAEAEREIETDGEKKKVKGSASVMIDGKAVDLEKHSASAWQDWLPALVTTTAAQAITKQLPSGKGNLPRGETGSDKSVKELATIERQTNQRYRG